MQNRLRRGVATLLLLCTVLCTFYLRENAQPDYMQIPVTRVISYTALPEQKSAPEESYRRQRETQRSEEISALTQLARKGDAEAGALLQKMIRFSETELAVEQALQTLGYGAAVCAVREDAVMICLNERIDAGQARQIVEICVRLSGECAENVFILDENGYS